MEQVNNVIEEKNRLNGSFEVFDSTFENYGLELIGKGIDIKDNRTEVIMEFVVNDKLKLPADGINIMVNMYDSNNSILFHEEEYYEGEQDKIFCIEVLFYDTNINMLSNVKKIRLYCCKCVWGNYE